MTTKLSTVTLREHLGFTQTDRDRGKLFVLGDDRTRSLTLADFGWVRLEMIDGVAYWAPPTLVHSSIEASPVDQADPPTLRPEQPTRPDLAPVAAKRRKS